jgi:hypothetical protein
MNIMKDKIIILLSTIMLFSCSSENNNIVEPQEEPLTVELVTTNSTTTIDEVVSFEVKTSNPFSSITYSTDNFTTSRTVSKSQGDSFGTSLTLYVNTANFGDITYSIRVVDANDNQKTATSSFLPSVDVKIGDWSFGLSPALAFGRATGFGVNVSASYNDGNFTFSAGYGVTLYGSAHGNGNKGWEYRKSWGVNWDDGKQGFGVYKTTFSGVNSQKVGGLSYRNGDVGFRYENDGAPFGGTLGDGGDRKRTAALSLSYKDYSIGFNIFTGEYANEKDTDPVASHPDSSERRKYLFGLLGEKGVKGGQYNSGTADDPNQRMGALYFGYKGYRLGGNSVVFQ